MFIIITFDMRIQFLNNPGNLIRFRCPEKGGVSFNKILNPSRNKKKIHLVIKCYNSEITSRLCCMDRKILKY